MLSIGCIASGQSAAVEIYRYVDSKGQVRLLAGHGAVGIDRVLAMPENSGIRQHVVRGLERSGKLGEARFPRVEYLDMPVSTSTGDSVEAARRMRAAGVAAIIVLGGDGTHRAVVSASRGCRVSVPFFSFFPFSCPFFLSLRWDGCRRSDVSVEPGMTHGPSPRAQDFP